MSQFAGTVLLGDLDDFISPSQACVNPLFATEKPEEPARATGAPRISLNVEESGTAPDLIKGSSERAQVSLNDCLACSGCVTSAEAVLVTEQSREKVKRLVEEFDGVLRVVSVSAQSLAALAVRYEVSSVVMLERLRDFFGKQGFDAVLDLSIASGVVLEEVVAEVLERRGRRNVWERPETSVAVDSKQDRVILEDGESKTVEFVERDDAERVCGSVMASACPGWVCFVEKTHPEAIPFLSQVQSPQAAMGTLLKHVVGRWSPKEVLHVSVMPCFDKKLEASRLDFWDAANASRDVDCVLSTEEVAGWLEEEEGEEEDGRKMDVDFEGVDEVEESPKNIGFEGVEEEEEDVLRLRRYEEELPEELKVVFGGMAGNVEDMNGSGGFLWHVGRRVSEVLWGPGAWKPQIRKGRQADWTEVTVPCPDGSSPPLRLLAAYGFRNIQGVISRAKRNALDFDFIEIMACPSGCVNGGGQPQPSLPPVTGAASARTRKKLQAEHILRVTDNLHSSYRPPERNHKLQQLYNTFLEESPGSPTAKALFRTRYHAVPGLETSSTSTTAAIAAAAPTAW